MTTTDRSIAASEDNPTGTRPLLTWERDPDGVVVLSVNDPALTVDTLSDPFVRDLEAVVEHLWAGREELTGVIVELDGSPPPVGRDLNDIVQATAEQAGRRAEVIGRLHRATRTLERLSVPVVAAIAGPALGGTFELALACTHRIAANRPRIQLGFPETELGLLPTGGGVVRTVRLVGLEPGLTKVLLPGRALGVAEASALGMIDQIVDNPGDLLPAARSWIAANPGAVQRWDRPGYRIPGGDPATPEVAVYLTSLPALLRRRARGPLQPGVRNLLAAAVEGAQVDLMTALAIESRYGIELICGKVSTNLIQSKHFDLQTILEGTNRPAGAAPAQVAKVVVLGAGMMGSGIAYAFACAEIEVVLKDVSMEAALAGKMKAALLVERAVGAGRIDRETGDAVLARIQPSDTPSDASGADLVIEAVFEDPELKQRVLGEIFTYLPSSAVIASNTSTLPISQLAESVPAPEDFIGTHFFSPVDQMRLVEVVVGEKTSEATIARTLDIVRQIGKVPIVVNDRRGFFTSRVISRFMDEALAMVGEGVAAATIEQAAMQAGYPLGPLALLDEVTLTLNRRIRRETDQAERAAGGQITVHPAAAVVDRMIDEFARTGRVGGAGFYDYAQGRRVGLWGGLEGAFGPRRTDTLLVDVQERLLFSEAIDAVRCLDQGVLRSVADGNVGSLLGIGFPAWTGGALQYINQYEGGVPGFAARARRLAERHGDVFTPPPSLVAVAHAEGVYS
jgi:3-hydroxyacyl-CoA dehydrogenase/enoyl-CoA hydratase/3-hydroxybutyryl-CoA epimerase